MVIALDGQTVSYKEIAFEKEHGAAKIMEQ